MATRGIPVGPPPGLAVPGPGGAQLPGLRDILPSLIRIETVHSRPSYAQPWQQGRSVASMSSGFAIRGKRILTNAHAVAGAAQVRVRRAGSAKRYAAQVVAIGRDCDLAMLAVPDAEFWAPRPAVQAKQGQTARQFDYIDIFERAPDLLPDLEERISVVGFPAGGESVSITSGIVSRIEMQLYTNGNLRLLAVQVDAAINPGNSGGPVFDGRRRFVGIAFQSLAGYGIQVGSLSSKASE